MSRKLGLNWIHKLPIYSGWIALTTIASVMVNTQRWLALEWLAMVARRCTMLGWPGWMSGSRGTGWSASGSWRPLLLGLESYGRSPRLRADVVRPRSVAHIGLVPVRQPQSVHARHDWLATWCPIVPMVCPGILTTKMTCTCTVVKHHAMMFMRIQSLYIPPCMILYHVISSPLHNAYMYMYSSNQLISFFQFLFANFQNSMILQSQKVKLYDYTGKRPKTVWGGGQWIRSNSSYGTISGWTLS